MATATLSSISPASGPLGTAITLRGASFDDGAQAACPWLVATTYVSPTELRAVIPSTGLSGPAGGSYPVTVYARNEDGSISNTLTFTVETAWSAETQSWTTITAVCGEVPGFTRAGSVSDAQILVWMRTAAQSIAAAMLGRGLSLDSSTWQQAGTGSIEATPAGLLELINRLGAAASLAAAVGAQFSAQQEWALPKSLQRRFEEEMKTLRGGGYDLMFQPAAAVAETGARFAGGAQTDADGEDSESAFEKEMEF